MTTFPHHYTVELEGKERSGLLRAPPRPPIAGGPPVQFGGTDQWWSPEELLLGSVGMCLMTTFQNLSAREHLAARSYRSRVEGTLDKTASGLAFTSIRIEVQLKVDAVDVSRAEGLVRTAKKLCIISNSLKAPVTVDASVKAGLRARADVDDALAEGEQAGVPAVFVECPGTGHALDVLVPALLGPAGQAALRDVERFLACVAEAPVRVCGREVSSHERNVVVTIEATGWVDDLEPRL